MIKYLTDLHLVRYRDKRDNAQFVLSKEYRVVAFGVTITVPAGFKTDFSSVPRGFRWLVSVTDGIEGSIVHDRLYRLPGTYTRSFADSVMEAMDRQQLGWFRRKSKWLGVRAGGWYTWRRARRGLADD